jgi:hypothetical protein
MSVPLGLRTLSLRPVPDRVILSALFGGHLKRLVLIVILAIIAHAVLAEDTKDYGLRKTQEIMLSNLKKEGAFGCIALPLSVEYLIIGWYPTWLEKRYTEKRMIAEAKQIAEQSKGVLKALLLISYVGDSTSQGRAELNIPEDLAEYVFVENESGIFFPCIEAYVSPLRRTVNALNETTPVALSFKVTQALFENAQTLIITVGGLGFQDKTFRYSLPLSSAFQDCPKEIREVFIHSGIWK